MEVMRLFATPRMLTLLVLGIFLQEAVYGQEQPIPAGGTNLIGEQALAQAGFWPGSGTVVRSTIPVSGPGFSKAVELEILDPAANDWDGQLQVGLDSAVSAGDVALLHFWMRVTESVDESGAGSVSAFVEKVASPYTRSVTATVTASSEWYPFYIPFAFASDYGVGGVQVKFGLGQGDPRTVQIGGLALYHYGDSRTVGELPQTAFTYFGRSQDAAWRAAAEARIETHRKGDFTLNLQREQGGPLSAEVVLNLVRHAFHFASVIDARTLNGTGPDNATYREKMVELFNASGTENDLKWPPLVGDWGPGFNYGQTTTALEWLRLRGFFLRGHVLVWPGSSNLPDFISARLSAGGQQRAEVPQLVLAHITETVATYAPWINEWDVINEPYTNTTLQDIFGAENPDLFADWFQEARETAGPEVGLYLNDYAILSGLGQNTAKRAATIATIRDIRDNGGPITGMGFQGHFDESSLTAIPRVYDILEEFSTEFPDLRFRITEYDVTTEDEALQADYLRDFLTIVFSHPQVDGFQFWGFWAGRHWRPSGALFGVDWTARQQLQAYRNLRESWHSEFNLTTDSLGRVSGRGFKGEYAGRLTTAEGSYDLILPILEAQNNVSLSLPAPANITETRSLGAAGPGLIAVVYPTSSSGTYWIETSPDGTDWREISLPQAGTGLPQVRIIPIPPRDTFWRVVTGPLP